MSIRTSRRTFITAATVAGMGYWAAGGVQAQDSKSPNERVRFACIGVGGKGSSDSADAGKAGDVVAICDIDDLILNGAAKGFAKAEKFNDFRKMFDKLGKSIDAVTVSTPDHTHAVATLTAMKQGKHCFTQKPLTHCVWESRELARVAKEQKVATQMGNQGTANNSLREAAAQIKAGCCGKVSEVHVWTNRPIWPQGQARPSKAESIPGNVHWDLWLGPAAERDYAQGYHQFKWRGWWDFGTGALGDMACHTLNMPYMALALKDPTAISASHSGHNGDSYPARSKIVYEYPANDSRGPVKLFWYDGGNRPAKDLLGDSALEVSGSGALIIGDKGCLYAPGDYAEGKIHFTKGAEKKEVDFPRSRGHFTEWVDAIKDRSKEAMSNFPGYACGLTETVLLGNLAVYASKKEGQEARVEWDAKNMKATGAEGLDAIVKNPVRKGWEV